MMGQPVAAIDDPPAGIVRMRGEFLARDQCRKSHRFLSSIKFPGGMPSFDPSETKKFFGHDSGLARGNHVAVIPLATISRIASHVGFRAIIFRNEAGLCFGLQDILSSLLGQKPGRLSGLSGGDGGGA
jgi:hypothetical protein